MYISEEYKDYIKENTSLLERLRRYCDFSDRQKGLIKTICPLPDHDETEGSLVYYYNDDTATCYGCNTYLGDAIDLIREMEGLNFNEAVIELAKQEGLKMPSGDMEKQYRKENKIKQKIKKVTNIFHDELFKKPDILNYLTERRGLTQKMIKTFKLGFCKYNKKEKFSKLSNRIIIPIRNKRGQPVGFGGRILPKNEGKYPAYINSSSEDFSFFRKKELVFNFDKALKHIKKNNFVIWVEGFFDVITLYQYGVKNVVASMGTSITEEQIKKVRRYTNNVLLFLDPDEAGDRTVKKTINVFEKYHYNIEIVDNKTDRDPAELAVYKKEKIQDFINKNSKPFEDYFTSRILENYNTTISRAKRKTIQQLAEVFKERIDNVEVDIALSSAANTLKISSQALKKKIRKELEYESN